LYDIFRQHDSSWVFFARFLPWARSLISIPAWSAGMNDIKFFILTYTGTLIWTTLRTLIGYFFWSQQDWILWLLDQYEHRALGLLAIIVVWLIVWSIRKTKKK
jgi:membrane protein DedA with SNARE-associated domain